MPHEWIFACPPTSFPVHPEGHNALAFSVLLHGNVVPSGSPSAHHPYMQFGSYHALSPHRLPQVQTCDEASLCPPCLPLLVPECLLLGGG